MLCFNIIIVSLAVHDKVSMLLLSDFFSGLNNVILWKKFVSVTANAEFLSITILKIDIVKLV